MPDIKDKMPERSFLPRTISSKLPFSSSKIQELKKIFLTADNSSMETMMTDTLAECERAPSAGETKRCVSSAEDMIDFSTSVLGRSVVVRTTDSVAGSKSDVMIGSVKGINGGRVTRSVSCHQSMFPYLLYYCHSVPKVRVYVADILDPSSKAKINRGVAICHLDTSSWSPTHGSFLALGSKPGQIEVCHWIFENDLTWAVADWPDPTDSNRNISWFDLRFEPIGWRKSLRLLVHSQVKSLTFSYNQVICGIAIFFFFWLIKQSKCLMSYGSLFLFLILFSYMILIIYDMPNVVFFFFLGYFLVASSIIWRPANARTVLRCYLSEANYYLFMLVLLFAFLILFKSLV